jgi:hypothetical protein
MWIEPHKEMEYLGLVGNAKGQVFIQRRRILRGCAAIRIRGVKEKAPPQIFNIGANLDPPAQRMSDYAFYDQATLSMLIESVAPATGQMILQARSA